MKKATFILLIALSGLSFHTSAQGDLMITPKRVVFEGNRQKEELNLVNIGHDTATYIISFVQYNMQEDGSMIIIEKPDSGQMFADPYLRLFPRKVTLAPGEPQVIALQCRRKPDMQAGEYRSHLYFRPDKNHTPLGSRSSTKDTTLVSVQLVPIFGMSIPVIIRSGAVHFSGTLSNLKLEKKQDSLQYLKITINRQGNISMYGNLVVDYIPVQGKPYSIGTLKGVGVYTNINKRAVSIRLDNAQGKIQKSGKLKVRYTSPDESKYIVYAEAELVSQ